MEFSLHRTVSPVELPVTLREVKQQVELPVSSTERDDQLTLLVEAATRNFERATRRALLPQTWVYERFYPVNSIELPRPPLLSITTVESRTLLTDAWAAVAAEDYTVESTRQPARLTWVDAIPKMVRVTYQAGYADVSSVPVEFKLTILQLVTFYLENRGDVNAVMPVALQGMIEAQSAGACTGYWCQ